MTAAFARVLDGPFELGESPFWHDGLLWFVDITGRRLHRFDPVTGVTGRIEIDEDIGCAAPAKRGGFIAGLRSGLWLLDQAGGKKKLADNPEDQSISRFNDGTVDPAGRYLAGTVDQTRKDGNASLYRFDRRGLALMADGLLTSNGLAFSPDGRTLYHADTLRWVVYRYDYNPATGAAQNRRTFITFDRAATGPGRPDGAVVDEQGCYWTALYAGARVERYDRHGRLMAVFPIQAENPTMPAFGGPDRKTLYVTTAADGLFAMPVDCPGLPVRLFDPDQ